MAKRGGLGRGLDALIPDREPKKPAKKKKTQEEKTSSAAKTSKIEKTAKTTKTTKTSKAEKQTKAVKPDKPEKTAVMSSKLTKTSKTSITKQTSDTGTTARGRKPAAKTTITEPKPLTRKKSSAVTKREQLIASDVTELEESALPVVQANNEREVTASDVSIDGTSTGDVISMRISLVEPNRDQPRKYFDDLAIAELADSVRQFGIIQPLLVQKKDDYYEIIAGERRWRAAQKAGLREVPVIVKNFSNQEAVEVSLIENIQREDLNPIEEAKAYDRLVRDYGLSQEAVAKRVSKSRSAVTNSMRLLRLEESVQKMVETGELSEGHARAILGIPSMDVQKTVAETVAKGHLSVRQTEKLVRETNRPRSASSRKTPNALDEAILLDLTEKLKIALGTKVNIRPSGKKGGRIEIEYYSDDDLDRLYELLRTVR